MEKKNYMSDLIFMSLISIALIWFFVLAESLFGDHLIIFTISLSFVFVSFVIGFFVSTAASCNGSYKIWVPLYFPLVMPLISDFLRIPILAETWSLAIGLFLSGNFFGNLFGLKMYSMIKRAGLY